MNNKCMVCGAKMNSRRENHAYSPSPGVNSVTLKDIVVRYCSECGENEVSIPKIHRLHTLIAQMIARKDGRLTSAEIRFLRSHLGWSGVEFAHQFEVTPGTVSRWENGKQNMGPIAEKLLRMYALYLDPADEEDLTNVKHKRVMPNRIRMELVDGDWTLPAFLQPVD